MTVELAKRAVACKGWRWMPGVPTTQGYRATDDDCHGGVRINFGASGHLPDLSDPATLGCLLHLVREAWDDPAAHVWRFGTTAGGTRWLFDANSGTCSTADTEAEALVAALEAAP